MLLVDVEPVIEWCPFALVDELAERSVALFFIRNDSIVDVDVVESES